jgi:release factor glutamine methyltransferase
MLDARVLAKWALGATDVELITMDRQPIDDASRARLDAAFLRRASGEPVAHIIGRREFWSLDIEVEPGILVPRADSETLIEAVVRLRARQAPLSIIDLGCGSGALLCALLTEFPAATGLGVDIDPAAVALTARNLIRLGFADRARAARGDWFEGIGDRFDVIVSNPPYIRTADRDALSREVRDFENPAALFAGADGLDAYRAILSAAPARLAAAGLAALEFGAGQAQAVNEIARAAFPAAQIALENDLSGRPRAVIIDLSPAAH